ncbi:NYN domain-containing protein [bacterium]|nr:NYN domain-containing protein [bacterium]
MTFNTAIFYDIENLLKGYGFSQNLISNLSLKEILEEIKETKQIGKIAVQRAYANWSDPRLGFLKNEILELGIDPIQVFGFMQGPRKNAADIQLAIDAMEMACQKESLENFVIISGDGGFASLAKKLHEYGKTVVGCAYETATNKVLASVCDAFVWIEDPEEDFTPKTNYSQTFRETTNNKSNTEMLTNDPRVVKMTQSIKPSFVSEKSAVLEKVCEVLDWFRNNRETKTELIERGIPLSVVKEGITYAIAGFDAAKIGFPKFVEFMQFVCSGTDLATFDVKGTGAKLAFRKLNKIGTQLPDLTDREIHSVEFYRSLLAKEQPVFKLPDFESVRKVAVYLEKNPVRSELIGETIEKFSNLLQGNVEQEAVKFSLLCFLAAECFERIPEDALLSEQKLTLKEEFLTAEKIISKLTFGMKEKIKNRLGEVKENIFYELINF